MKSNVEKGQDFVRVAQPVLEQNLGVRLEREVPLKIGNPPKNHKFDLVSNNREWVIECKNYSWTISGNSPQAKIASLSDAVRMLRSVDAKCHKAIVMSRATHTSKRETLAEYYLRLNHNVLGDVALGEINVESRELRWLTRNIV